LETAHLVDLVVLLVLVRVLEPLTVLRPLADILAGRPKRGATEHKRLLARVPERNGFRRFARLA